MQNINRIALVGGIIFAVFDAICALFSAFALEPFLAFWSIVAHIRLIGVGVESHVTPASFAFGIVATFAVGYILTWLCVWLHKKFCCVDSAAREK